jgi:hypothetical protein
MRFQLHRFHKVLKGLSVNGEMQEEAEGSDGGLF